MHFLHVWVVGNWCGGGRPELENGLWPPADGEALSYLHTAVQVFSVMAPLMLVACKQAVKNS